MFNILVVCTANICRSPAAESFLRLALKDAPVNVHSAGTLAIDGNPADAMIQALMHERGHQNLPKHRSKALLPSHISKYQLILCMENSHLAYVQKTNMSSVGKTMLLGHWSNAQEVADPIGQARANYEQALVTIENFSAQWAKKIIDLGMA